jgi:general secretion pathway protein D
VKQDQLSGVAGVSDVPWLRRLFGSSQLQTQDTDIVMTLTPRIIRVPDITEADLQTLWVGTEEKMALRGAARDQLAQGPFHRGEGYEDLEASLAALPGGGAGTGGTSSISPSAEVERDRAAAEREKEEERLEQPQDLLDDDLDSGGAPPVPGQQDFDNDDDFDPGAGDDDGEEPAAVPTGPAAVRTLPSRSPASYSVGEQIVLNVSIENAVDIGSVPFHLRYDSSVVQFLAPASEGAFMSADGTSTVFLATDIAGGGEIVVGLSRLSGQQGATGSGILATFQFMAVGPGDARFAFTGASVKNPQAGNQPASFSAAPVRVQP